MEKFLIITPADLIKAINTFNQVSDWTSEIDEAVEGKELPYVLIGCYSEDVEFGSIYKFTAVSLNDFQLNTKITKMKILSAEEWLNENCQPKDWSNEANQTKDYIHTSDVHKYMERFFKDQAKKMLKALNEKGAVLESVSAQIILQVLNDRPKCPECGKVLSPAGGTLDGSEVYWACWDCNHNEPL